MGQQSKEAGTKRVGRVPLKPISENNLGHVENQQPKQKQQPVVKAQKAVVIKAPSQPKTTSESAKVEDKGVTSKNSQEISSSQAMDDNGSHNVGGDGVVSLSSLYSYHRGRNPPNPIFDSMVLERQLDVSHDNDHEMVIDEYVLGNKRPS